LRDEESRAITKKILRRQKTPPQNDTSR